MVNSKLSAKASKLCVFQGNIAKLFWFFEVLETKVVGECGDFKSDSRSQNIFDFYFARIPYLLYLLISVYNHLCLKRLRAGIDL